MAARSPLRQSSDAPNELPRFVKWKSRQQYLVTTGQSIQLRREIGRQTDDLGLATVIADLRDFTNMQADSHTQRGRVAMH